MNIRLDRKVWLLPLLLIIVAAPLVYLYSVSHAQENNGLRASGTVEAVEVIVSPELAGRVSEVLVAQGDRVQAGDPLLCLEDEILRAQRNLAIATREMAQANLGQAQTAAKTAEATLAAAQASLDLAQVQYDLERNAARFEALPARVSAWENAVPDEFSQPAWYFQRGEEIAAAEAEVRTARQALVVEQSNLEEVLKNASSADLVATETRLAKAQATFQVAQDVWIRAQVQENETLPTSAQELYDEAKAELDAAQLAYERMLSDQATAEVVEARARLSVAQERYETAQDRLSALQTGEDSLRVRAAAMALAQAQVGVQQAEASLAQAEASVLQAEKVVAQAQAELDLIDVQIDKLTVRAAVSGVVMTRNVEPGEVVQPAAAVMTIGQLDDLTITVYVTEDRYGQIHLGQTAQVTADSFPDQAFAASVTRIADQAEYTPRNVQTEDGRRTTVFAVELSVSDEGGQLKPGMPADVVFSQSR